MSNLERVIAALDTAIEAGYDILSPSTVKTLIAFREVAANRLKNYLAMKEGS